ncbi:L,D-transpeptidase [Coralliovum pocilloporae]|uniref:L,D-transpeptidase n=1 Tax=Coralliovum pocilloporae TaxID=3066369 RepID=UPI003D9C3084
MRKTLTRRQFVGAGASAAALALAGCQTTRDGDPSFISNFAEDYGPRPEEKFPLPAISPSVLKPQLRRRRIRYETDERPGSLVVDTSSFYLYLVERNGTAMRYGVGLGRQGFEWSGRANVAWKRPWPTWTPPDEMIARRPELEKYSIRNGGMPPGLRNPLGARALYIFQNGVDTLYRLHGTNEPHSIGKAVSSGCVRLVNQDVIDLYNRVKPGARILVT